MDPDGVDEIRFEVFFEASVKEIEDDGAVSGEGR